MAASVAARINISIDQQSELFEKVLVRGRSNEINQYVDRLFVHRMGISRMIGILRKHEVSCPKGVYFAAYYLGANRVVPEKKKKKIIDMFQRVRLGITDGAKE